MGARKQADTGRLAQTEGKGNNYNARHCARNRTEHKARQEKTRSKRNNRDETKRRIRRKPSGERQKKRQHPVGEMQPPRDRRRRVGDKRGHGT